MADVADLKHMVTSFRVSELQVLLGFAGRNKSGRKNELLQRALGLIGKGCSTPVQIKIRELYRRRFPGKTPQPAAQAVPQSTNMEVAGMGPMDFRKHPVPMDSAPAHNSLPVHPDVRLKRLPFYDILGELLKPTTLVPRNTSRFQETFFVFHLTPQQAQDIAMYRDIRPNARCEFQVQVQLRFCLLETSCEQEDNFPPSICVRVNGKMAQLPNPIPTNKPGMEPKRPSRPVDITSICRISPTVANHVNVSWASEFGRGYCVSVYLVRRLTSEELLTRLKQRGLRHPDHTKALIKEKLAHDPDSEIATTSLRVSLMCPLGKMRMIMPCRASTCNHLQCCDAPTFLQMNEKKPTWVCPVCDKPLEFDNLVIDGYFSQILKTSPELKEIQFLEDGSWQPLKSKDQEKPSTSCSNGAEPDIQTIGDSPKKEKSVEVIDLTESDDEVEEEKPNVIDSGANHPSNISTCSNGSTESLMSSSSSSSSCSSSDSSGGSSITLAGPGLQSPSLLGSSSLLPPALLTRSSTRSNSITEVTPIDAGTSSTFPEVIPLENEPSTSSKSASSVSVSEGPLPLSEETPSVGDEVSISNSFPLEPMDISGVDLFTFLENDSENETSDEEFENFLLQMRSAANGVNLPSSLRSRETSGTLHTPTLSLKNRDDTSSPDIIPLD